MIDSDDHQPILYTELAPWFHLLTAPADYAPGGGNNASHMKAHATMTLTDLSEDMLALSRTLNPECEHIQGDMRTLRLDGRTFDGVFVHDAID